MAIYEQFRTRLMDDQESAFRWYGGMLAYVMNDEHHQENLSILPGGPVDCLPRVLLVADGLDAEQGLANRWNASTMLNFVGDNYPLASRTTRKEVLKKCISFLGEKHEVGKEYVARIEEPLLVSDIIVNRPYYWPDFSDVEPVVRGCKTYEELSKKASRLPSAFMYAYPLMLNNVVSANARTGFYISEEHLLRRMEYAAAAFVYMKALELHGTGRMSSLDAAVNEALLPFEEFLRPSIREKVHEGKWVLLDSEHLS
jgi:hypothetical protein